MAKLRDWIRFAWKWSWLVTFPVSCVFVLWCIMVAERFHDFGIRYATLGDYCHLLQVGRMEAEHLIKKAELAITPEHAPTGDGLRRVDLFVTAGDEAKLDESLPRSGQSYVKGALLYPGGSIEKVDLRYRGDFFWHWAMYKKSWRVKTKKKDLFDRMRKFNLIAPKGKVKILGHLAYWLAREMDLLAPASELVELHINGENRGVFLLVEQLEELVLRKAGRMPGDLFAGELIGKDGWTGVNAHVFSHPDLWEKVAVNNHFPPEANESLRRLCDLTMGPRTDERMDELIALLDLEAWGRFAAYRVIVQSAHYGESHNWRLYYDPWRNHFEPVVWDPNGWQKNKMPRRGEKAALDIICSWIDRQLVHDYRYLLAQQRAIVDYFESGLHERLLREYDRTAESVRGAFHNDPSLVDNFTYSSPGQTMAAIAARRAMIVQTADQIRFAYTGKDGQFATCIDTGRLEDGELKIQLGLVGRRPIDRLELDLRFRPEASLTVHIAYHTGGERREVDVTGALRVQGAHLVVERPLMSGFRYQEDISRKNGFQEWLKLEAGYYELILRGLDPENEVTDIRAGYGTGPTIRSTSIKKIPIIEHFDAYGIVEPAEVVEPTVLTGEIPVHGFNVYSGPQVITAGTTFLMHPGASIIFEGKVTANGSAEQPIMIIPNAEGQEPWGVFALRGPDAAGSELTHCVFAGGSGHKVPLAEYSAMFSVHDVPDVLVRDCQFRDSQVVDDMVHAVYSSIRFENCVFQRSLFDAVDLDICTGAVIGCRFEQSGNDALDLMTSTIVVKDTVLLESADKGVSVGEGTDAFIINCEITGCEIGLQAKDGSTATIANCDFTRNKKALDAYKKNWRYDAGGTVYIYDSVIEGSESTLTADKHSSFLVHDCWIDRADDFKKRIRLTPSVSLGGGKGKKRRSRHPRPFRFPRERKHSSDLFAPYWPTARPRQRGAKLRR